MREGSYALGTTRSETIKQVLLPAALPGIISAFLLAVSRALGETMAVLMVAGNVAQVPDSLLDPVRSLTANIALELGYAAGAHRSALFVSGLVLMAMVTGLMLTAHGVRRRYGHD